MIKTSDIKTCVNCNNDFVDLLNPEDPREICIECLTQKEPTAREIKEAWMRFKPKVPLVYAFAAYLSRKRLHEHHN